MLHLSGVDLTWALTSWEEQELAGLCDAHILLFKAMPASISSLSPTCTPLPLVPQSGLPEPQRTQTQKHPKHTVWGYVLHAYKLSVLNGLLKFLKLCMGGVGGTE